MRITEIFLSIQGESSYAGGPCVFVRTTGCNLRCAWCDTPYTSWAPEGEPRSLDAILDAVGRWPDVGHVVLTGGEPMLAPDVAELARRLRDGGARHLTIETAGTVDPPAEADLFSISPKLGNSTPEGDWAERHDRTRRALDVVRGLMQRGDYQLKFVVGEPADLDEVSAWLEELGGADPARVLLMPRARGLEELDRVRAWLPDLARERGLGVTDRLHLRLFGDARGT